MSVAVSVLLSAHNPHQGRLRRTLDGLLAQTLSTNDWELVVVDNASTPALDGQKLGLERHGRARLVREERLGLIYGRIAGIEASRGPIVVFCDDDIVLAPDYLTRVIEIFSADPRLGNACGKIFPDFEIVPAFWTQEFYGNLGLRDFGNEQQVHEGWSRDYPNSAGGGGGAAFRRSALVGVLRAGIDIPGRAGQDLSSGEDNDIILSLLRDGWRVGYFPELMMTHIIPAARLGPAYLGRLNHGIAKSWLQVLALHGICPWKPAPKWSIPLRKGRAYLRYRAWAGPAEYVRWRGACGHFEGRAIIGSIKGRDRAS
jgi:glycosyltransferase involved in cell wall biosynthesis